MSGARFNPFPLLVAAGAGDLEAQRTLAREGARIAAEDGDLFAALEALCFARLAAANGSAADRLCVLTTLDIASSLCAPHEAYIRDMLGGELLALVSLMADDGNDLAADRLLSLAEACTPETVANSKQYRELMTAEGK